VVPIGFDDANLVGANVLVYAKFVGVSDSRCRRFWMESVVRCGATLPVGHGIKWDRHKMLFRTHRFL